MTLEEIYFASQIVAAISIVATLIFVALQVRQSSEQIKLNTRAIKASASFDARLAWADSLHDDSKRSDEEIGLWLRTYDPQMSWDDFSPEERARVAIHFRHLLLRLEGLFHLYTYGILDKDHWVGRRDFLARSIALPFYERCWALEKEQGNLSVTFIAALDGARGAAGPAPWTGFSTANEERLARPSDQKAAP